MKNLKSQLPQTRILAISALNMLLKESPYKLPADEQSAASGDLQENGNSSLKGTLTNIFQEQGFFSDTFDSLSNVHIISDTENSSSGGGHGNSSFQSLADKCITRFNFDFLSSWPRTPTSISLFGNDTFYSSFARIFKRLVQEYVAAEAFAGLLHADVIGLAEAWDSWMMAQLQNILLAPSVELTPEWANCIRYAITRKGKYGTKVPFLRQRILDCLIEPLPQTEDETINIFTTKLTTLVNKAASLGHTMENETLVRKLLNVVPDGYLQIVTSIEQYSDLSEMNLEEAIVRLKTYEERIKIKTNEQSNLVEEDLEPTLLMAILEDEEQEVSLHEKFVGYKETNMYSLWYLDNRASNHMTGVREHFKELDKEVNGKAEAVRHPIYILNSVPTKALEDITLYEAIKRRKPNLENLRVFSCIAYAKVPSQHLTKLDDKSTKMVYLGNKQESKAYRLFDPTTQRVCVSRDMKFKEDEAWDWKDYMIRGFRTLNDLYGNTEELLLAEDEPRNYKEASSDKKWIEAMKVELDSINRSNTWELTTLPKGHKAIGLKWVFKTKKDANGNKIKHKAILVANGYIQQHGIDFEEVFAPVARMETVRLLLAIAANNKWEVYHLDVKFAFLHRDLKEEVYVTQPEGFIKRQDNEKVYRLIKALYGKRQAPRAWNIKLDNTLKSLYFKKGALQQAVYTKTSNNSTLLI
uniref:Ribonuclease H-like domain, reverse transcriptase, RNA-dependent DNA polymerase n=1 Tax=Tanacetum cinerariifolium TaxID=118510 RepID=A0A699HGA1_TANCI|nr:ribonuclease H-like domain, reverse transcriptase, RNA-dependent DNA polymerase [Tanacetum cinerariifolium]